MNETLIFERIEIDLSKSYTYPVFLLKVVDKNLLSSDEVIGYNYFSVINKINILKFLKFF